jgi:hypothetical protein
MNNGLSKTYMIYNENKSEIDFTIWPCLLLIVGLSINEFGRPIFCILEVKRGSVSSLDFYLNIIFIILSFKYYTTFRNDTTFLYFTYILIFIAFWVFLGSIINDTSIKTYFTVTSFVFFQNSGYFIFYNNRNAILSRIHYGLIGISLLWNVFIIWSIISGRITIFVSEGIQRIYWPGQFHSTEIPIYLGFQFCYLVYTYLYIRNIWIRIITIAILFCNIYIMLLCGARSALLGYLLVVCIFVFFYIRQNPGKHLRTFLSIFTIFIAFTMFNFDRIEEVSTSFISRVTHQNDYGRRLRFDRIYPVTWNIATKNPWFGIGSDKWGIIGVLAGLKTEYGLSKQTPPHQNFLGFAALRGFPAAIVFFGYAMYFTYVCLKTLLIATRHGTEARAVDNRIVGLLILSFTCFVYQQFRGLIQDTWMLKETYIWCGIGLACVRYLTKFRMKA